MKLLFADKGWEDYLYEQKPDMRLVERINKLTVEGRASLGGLKGKLGGQIQKTYIKLWHEPNNTTVQQSTILRQNLRLMAHAHLKSSTMPGQDIRDINVLG